MSRTRGHRNCARSSCGVCNVDPRGRNKRDREALGDDALTQEHVPSDDCASGACMQCAAILAGEPEPECDCYDGYVCSYHSAFSDSGPLTAPFLDVIRQHR